jgi:ribosomal protein L12E/L44/L45/RPP1/RPP2
MAGLMDEVEGETSGPAAKDEEPPSVSEERLEAVITGALTEVVERVVRQTVAEVTERVIKEAIESLRQSLEPTPE